MFHQNAFQHNAVQAESGASADVSAVAIWLRGTRPARSRSVCSPPRTEASPFLPVPKAAEAALSLSPAAAQLQTNSVAPTAVQNITRHPAAGQLQVNGAAPAALQDYR